MLNHVEKFYGHNEGWSCCFRQPTAKSHCRFLHGYPLAFRFRFAALDLDARNWVIDFGAMKPLKDWLKNNFDHRTCISEHDTHLDEFRRLHDMGIIDLNVMPGAGMEAFAMLAYDAAVDILAEVAPLHLSPPGGKRVTLVEVGVWEHEGNAAFTDHGWREHQFKNMSETARLL